MSEQVNRKCPSKNVPVAYNFQPCTNSPPQNAQCSTQIAYVTWRTLCSRYDEHADHV